MKFCASVLLAYVMSQQQVTAVSQDIIPDECFTWEKIWLQEFDDGDACEDKIQNAYDECLSVYANEETERCNNFYDAMMELSEDTFNEKKEPNTLDALCIDKNNKEEWIC